MLDRLILGDTLNFTTSVADFSAADGWTLNYRFVPIGTTGVAVDMSGIPDATDASLHRIQATATTTSGWVPGDYTWHSYVQRGSEQYTVSSGQVKFLQDPRTAALSLDLRTPARKALDQALEARAAWTPTTKKYRIGEREMEFQSIAEVNVLIDRLRLEVSREENAIGMSKGRADKRKVYVRCGRV